MQILSIRTTAVARLSGSFASISHDVNQPLDAAIQTGLGNIFAVDAARDSSTENRHCVSDRAQDGPAERVRIVQRSTAWKRRRPGGRESALLQDLPRRSPRHRRRNDHRARSAGQRRRCDRLPPIKYSIRVSLRANFPARLRCRMQIPACNRLRSPPSRMESCTRLISCSGASRWNSRSATRSICGLSMLARAR